MNDTPHNHTSSGGVDAFILKIIAIVTMTLNHIAAVFEIEPAWVETLMIMVGGMTFPIMAFLLVEGYKHTSNFKRYASRLLLFAIIAYLPFLWAFEGYDLDNPCSFLHLNILFTLLLGLIALYLYDNVKNRIVLLLILAVLCLSTKIMDWPLIGIPMILLYYVLRGRWSRVIIPIIIPIANALVILLQLHLSLELILLNIDTLAFFVVGGAMTIPLLAKYNGERGRPLKYAFYFYYPVHLVVIVLVYRLLF